MENLTNLLEKLAEKLGTTVEFLWGVLVKQAHIIAYINLSVAGLFFLLMIYGLFRLMKDPPTPIPNDEMYAPHVVGIILLIVGVVVVLVTGISGFVALLNPEYWALRKVLRII